MGHTSWENNANSQNHICLNNAHLVFHIFVTTVLIIQYTVFILQLFADLLEDPVHRCIIVHINIETNTCHFFPKYLTFLKQSKCSFKLIAIANRTEKF